MLNRQRADEIFKKVLKWSTADETEAMIGSTAYSLTRFANNIIHQNVAEEGSYLSVRAVVDYRTARATTNKFDEDSIRDACEKALTLARLQPPDPDLLPMPGPQTYRSVDRFDEETAKLSPQARAETVRQATARAEKDHLTAAGACSSGANVSIRDDVYHPMQGGTTFDGEGMPRQKVKLVEKGVVCRLVYSRQTAHKLNSKSTGHGFPLPNDIGEAPMNIVLDGGKSSTEEMVRSTERGLLVTRLWYIREVDPYQKILTGMTRDGTFWIEDGQVRYGVRNFRFNQSIIEMLGQVEMMTPPQRTAGEESFEMVVPGMKVREFNLSSLTKF